MCLWLCALSMKTVVLSATAFSPLEWAVSAQAILGFSEFVHQGST